MKSKKRHELQTNILADWLGHKIEHLRPHANMIFAGVVIIAVLAIAFTYFRNQQSAKVAGGWEAYFAALNERDSERLSAVAADYTGTTVALCAKQSEGDLELARGNDSLYSDRDAAKDALERARDCFEEVVEGAGELPRLKRRAQLGLAKALESLGGLTAVEDTEDLEAAARLYTQLAQATPGTALGSFAAERADTLGRETVIDWYGWFSRQKPAPPPGMPGGDMGTGTPGIPGLPKPMTNLPDLPDFSAFGGDSSTDADEDMGEQTLEPVGEKPAKPAPEEPAVSEDTNATPAAEAAVPESPPAEPKPEATSPPEPEAQPEDKPAAKPEAGPALTPPKQ
jgi:hypothetical protein